MNMMPLDAYVETKIICGDIWDDLGVLGKITLFPLLVLLTPVMYFIMLCAKGESK
jgi:hypothetical protein